MPGFDGEVDSLAVGKKQCVIIGAVHEPLWCVESLNQAALRALVAVGLGRIGNARGDDKKGEDGEDQWFHLGGSLVI